MKLSGKAVSLRDLTAQFQAVGLPVRALVVFDDELFDCDENGNPVELASTVAAQAVVEAHKKPAPSKSDREILTAALKATPVVADKLALIEAWLEGADALAVAVEAQKARIQPVIG